MSQELVMAMAEMKEAEALELAGSLLESGADPLGVMEQCRAAVELVGQKFEEGTYFLPELIMAGEMMKKIAELAEPYLKQSAAGSAESRGVVLMGSVMGDIHDIGKDMVAFMLDVNGFQVQDLGVDLPPQVIIEAIREHQPQVVGLSALLSTVLDNLKATVEAITEAGLRDEVRIMIGGCAVDEGVREFSGADGYGRDAVAAVRLAKEWTS